MQPTDIAVELRPRTPWEAIDLGLAMLQRWWRQAYGAHAAALALICALSLSAAWWLDHPGVALLILWWLKPVCDRAVLHVLSRAVFGEMQGVRATLANAGEWMRSGLFMALTFGRFDFARSFNLPVRQLEGQRGSAARERRSVLSRRTRSYAVWLTIVCVHFEMVVLYWSLNLFATMLLPASSVETHEFFDALVSRSTWSYADVFTYAGAVLILEPFYVAAGFALYLNRRTLLEGWDLEVALRRIAARAAPALLLLAIGALPLAALAQKDPRQEMAEVLKAPEFGYEHEVERWMPRGSREKKEAKAGVPDFSFGLWLSKIAQVVLWALIAAAIAYASWWVVRNLPRGGREPAVERYRAPASLLGMELSPQTLPADVPAAVRQLLSEGNARAALGLLYRASLSRLVHQRGVELHASHTEMEVLAAAPSEYLRRLIDAWRACAYADRVPSREAIEALVQAYAAA